jgi:hypothetical protein
MFTCPCLQALEIILMIVNGYFFDLIMTQLLVQRWNQVHQQYSSPSCYSQHNCQALCCVYCCKSKIAKVMIACRSFMSPLSNSKTATKPIDQSSLRSIRVFTKTTDIMFTKEYILNTLAYSILISATIKATELDHL